MRSKDPRSNSPDDRRPSRARKPRPRLPAEFPAHRDATADFVLSELNTRLKAPRPETADQNNPVLNYVRDWVALDPDCEDAQLDSVIAAYVLLNLKTWPDDPESVPVNVRVRNLFFASKLLDRVSDRNNLGGAARKLTGLVEEMLLRYSNELSEEPQSGSFLRLIQYYFDCAGLTFETPEVYDFLRATPLDPFFEAIVEIRRAIKAETQGSVDPPIAKLRDEVESGQMRDDHDRAVVALIRSIKGYLERTNRETVEFSALQQTLVEISIVRVSIVEKIGNDNLIVEASFYAARAAGSNSKNLVDFASKGIDAGETHFAGSLAPGESSLLLLSYRLGCLYRFRSDHGGEGAEDDLRAAAVHFNRFIDAAGEADAGSARSHGSVERWDALKTLCQIHSRFNDLDSCIEQTKALLSCSPPVRLDGNVVSRDRSGAMCKALQVFLSRRQIRESRQFFAAYRDTIPEKKYWIRPLGLLRYHKDSDGLRNEFEKLVAECAEHDPELKSILANQKQKESLFFAAEFREYCEVLESRIRAGDFYGVRKEMSPYVKFRKKYWIDGGGDNYELIWLYALASRFSGDAEEAESAYFFCFSLAQGQSQRARAKVAIGDLYRSESKTTEAFDFYREAFYLAPAPRSLAGVLDCAVSEDDCQRAFEVFERDWPDPVVSRPVVEAYIGFLLRQGGLRELLKSRFWEAGEAERGILEALVRPAIEDRVLDVLFKVVCNHLRSLDRDHGRLQFLVRVAARCCYVFYSREPADTFSRRLETLLSSVKENRYLLEDPTKVLADLFGGARNAIIATVLWRYFDLVKECIDADPGERVDLINRLLTGERWREVLPDQWTDRPAVSASLFCAHTLRAVVAAAGCKWGAAGVGPGRIKLSEAFLLRAVLKRSFPPASGSSPLLQRVARSDVEVSWSDATGFIELQLRFNLAGYQDAGLVWSACKGDIEEALVVDGLSSGSIGFRVVEKLVDEGVGMAFVSTPVRVENPTAEGAGMWLDFYEHLDRSFLSMMAGGERNEDFFQETRTILERHDHLLEGEAEIADRFGNCAARAFGLATACTLGLLPGRAKGSGSVSGLSAILHDLKSVLGRLRDEPDDAERQKVEVELEKKFYFMVSGFCGRRNLDNGESALGKYGTNFSNELAAVQAERSEARIRLPLNSDQFYVVPISRGRLRGIIEPLIDNAIQAAGEVAERDRGIEVEFRPLGDDDFGDPCESEEGGSARWLFVRISNPSPGNTVPKVGGTGIGVPAARSRVEAVGGRWMEPVERDGKYIQTFALPLLD